MDTTSHKDQTWGVLGRPVPKPYHGTREGKGAQGRRRERRKSQ
ncbi:hypothetical protein T4A_8841 [Trichinella pseudospiralis]|uniref:Uncharacterized protein n=1 Tax=Trichinella pseudospiralis TaxID=6337 RepID=A0A0V1DSG0_TRIPS|nr:hypothetical protein T4A_8841 [Trichinella pseudospiralis]